MSISRWTARRASQGGRQLSCWPLPNTRGRRWKCSARCVIPGSPPPPRPSPSLLSCPSAGSPSLLPTARRRPSPPPSSLSTSPSSSPPSAINSGSRRDAPPPASPEGTLLSKAWVLTGNDAFLPPRFGFDDDENDENEDENDDDDDDDEERSAGGDTLLPPPPPGRAGADG